MAEIQPGARVTVPTTHGDAQATVLAVQGATVYVNWDHDGGNVIASAPLADVVSV